MAIRLEEYQSGELRQGFQYRFFMPSEINSDWIWDNPQINRLVEKAALRLGELNTFARLVPDFDRFIRLHVVREAVASSRIEGAGIDVNEVLLPVEEMAPGRRDDWWTAVNCIRAMNEAVRALETLPVSSRLLKQAHRVLFDGTRSGHEVPGGFRTSQNRIGGSGLADAVFVPPAPEYVPGLMGDLDRFLQNEEIMLPALVRTGIAHCQFETIHPFPDGNGRTGRLLIVLFLLSEGIVRPPLLSLSSYFAKDRGLYYDSLMRVRTRNDMLQWLAYFLVGVEQAAAETAGMLNKAIVLKSKAEQRIHESLGRRATTATRLLGHLIEQPIISVGQAAAACGVSFRPANDLVALMCEHGILREVTGRSRNRLFAFDAYLRMFCFR